MTMINKNDFCSKANDFNRSIEVPSEAKGQRLELQDQGHDIRGQEHDKLSLKHLESKAMASRTPSPQYSVYN